MQHFPVKYVHCSVITTEVRLRNCAILTHFNEVAEEEGSSKVLFPSGKTLFRKKQPRIKSI